MAASDPRSETTELASLIEAARQGSKEALGRILAECRPYLLLIANEELDSDLRAKVGASDLVQETCVKVLAQFQGFRGASRPELSAWLRQVLLNHLADMRRHFRDTRKRQLRREVSLDQAGDELDDLRDRDPTPQTQARANERADSLDQALAGLPEHYRQLIRMRHLESRSFVEIGEALGCSADSVRKMWLRALEQLQSVWEIGHGADESG